MRENIDVAPSFDVKFGARGQKIHDFLASAVRFARQHIVQLALSLCK